MKRNKATRYRTENLKALAQALIIELTNAEYSVPPVPLLYDLDTAGMLCGMTRTELRAFLRSQGRRFAYKTNKFTKQQFLSGEDIKVIRSLVIESESIDYTTRAKNLPGVKARLARFGVGEGGSH